MSDDGQVVWLVANYTPWYVSKDGGSTWVQRTATGSGNWGIVRTTADGSIAISAGYTGIPYIFRERAGEFSEPALSLDIPASFFESASATGAAFSTREAASLQLARDVEHGGLGTIYGTVKEKNTPANTPLRRKVRLMDERSGLVIRETWSDAATGAYEFRGIKQGMPYTVLAYDHAHNYRAVIADNLLPEVLP